MGEFLQLLVRQCERGHSARCAVVYEIAYLTFAARSKRAIIHQRRRPVAAGCALPVAPGTELFEAGFLGETQVRDE